MGAAFARNLAQRGYRVLVYDIDGSRAEATRAAGCELADDTGSIVRENAQFVVTCLPSDKAFADVIRHLAGAADLAGGRHLPVVVDTSTLSLEAKQSGRDQLARAGMTLLDCPVSGTAAQAVTRDIVVFASGPDDTLSACQKVLEAMAREVRRVGEFGMGSRTKFLANLLVVVHTAAAAEMLALAELAGKEGPHDGRAHL
jgi:putative dehydrogenase